ncbi:hypothetical protein GGTG_13526 [Gaeumannomyces tritici R3-111a-1]|uniref:Uncharacterized protein n=1 Tax=Gaeumannomyces tritici (strain R3-111a-1) TaxID=644352 RepID=J3PJ43_GAET3|nr:hypothetical protein GGTG_13526 [Gaeumannomyces tritici R3-111a-1]EJT68937.1 hypothetical protein GGTG_13526 [Gaeumannomyces tritici R3-111a-1]
MAARPRSVIDASRGTPSVARFRLRGLESLLAWLVSVGADIVGRGVADPPRYGASHRRPPAFAQGCKCTEGTPYHNIASDFATSSVKGDVAAARARKLLLDRSKEFVEERVFRRSFIEPDLKLVLETPAIVKSNEYIDKLELERGMWRWRWSLPASTEVTLDEVSVEHGDDDRLLVGDDGLLIAEAYPRPAGVVHLRHLFYPDAALALLASM